MSHDIEKEVSEVIQEPIAVYTPSAVDSNAISRDPFQYALEQEWHRRVGAVLHGHTCSRCGLLRACLADPCPFRATQMEREWECGCGRNIEDVHKSIECFGEMMDSIGHDGTGG